MKAILSIDGGGIRGIIPAIILSQLEEYVGLPISSIFDLIAGTSTGGILALGLAKPTYNNQPEYSAASLVALYEQHGSLIFRRPAWRKSRPLRTLFEERYESRGLESVLDRYFGNCRLKSALTNVLVTSYEIERRFPFLFRSNVARQTPTYDFPMKLVARATSAAPTFFEPVKINADGPTGYYALVDGGLYANNPALCALVEARTLFGDEPLLVVSLGTGALTQPIVYEDARHWGLARWAKPVLDIAFDGVSSTVDYQLQRMLRTEAGQPQRYYRFQPVLDPGLTEMDDTSPRNLRRLKLLTETMLRDRNQDIITLSAALLRKTQL
ncbi:MAG: patatin-like phospholipase family protein [Bryobacteraceae bacterium]